MTVRVFIHSAAKRAETISVIDLTNKGSSSDDEEL